MTAESRIVDPMGDPSDDDVLDFNIVWYTAQQRHCIPCEIVEFDLANQTCSVRSTIEFVARNRSTGEIVARDTLTASGVPIGFYGTGSWALTGPIRVGDQGVCHVSDRCLAEWKSTTVTPATPGKVRRWNMNDAIWFPFHIRPAFPLPTGGPRPAVDIDNERVVLRVGDDEQLILGSLNVSSLVALADLVLDRLNQIRTWLNLHTHVAPMIGATGVPAASLGTIASVAADRVWAE